MKNSQTKQLLAILLLISMLLACRFGQQPAEPPADNAAPTEPATVLPTGDTSATADATAPADATATVGAPAPSATLAPTAEPTATFTPTPPPMMQVDEGGITAFAHQPVAAIVDGTIRTLHPGSNNTLWLVTGEMAVQWQEDHVQQQLGAFPGRFLGEDAANGRVWAATLENVLMAWDGSGWQTYGPQEGWEPLTNSPAYLYTGQTGANGRFWLPTNADLRYFDGQRWQRFTPADMGLQNIVDDSTWFAFTLLPAANGELWLGVCHVMPPGPAGGQGVRVYRDGVWHSEPGLPQSGCVSAISGDPDASLWLNVDDSLWHRSDSQSPWTSLTPPAPESGRYGNFGAIATGPAGDAWALAIVCGGASCGGLSTLFHVSAGLFTPIPGWEFPAFGAIALYMDHAGNLWATADDVLYRIPTASPQIAGQRPILSAAQTEDGYIWFVANAANNEPTLFSIR